MKYSIRDLLLVTFIVALAAGWYVDHRQAAKREAQWEKQFEQMAIKLSMASLMEHSFETPGGPWSVNRKPDPESRITMP